MRRRAAENQALAEVLIIASAISIQDPRERPLDAQDKAAAAHKKFADEKSDFLSLIKLWNWTQDAIANKESNRLLEQKFRQNYLSVKRLREWRDVYRQLKELTQEMGWRLNTAPATYEQLHKALLSGLLGNIGMKDVQADYKTPPYIGAGALSFGRGPVLLWRRRAANGLWLPRSWKQPAYLPERLRISSLSGLRRSART